MSELPLVSILTPSFQQGRYLADTLASVAAQDYPEIEHVVVDGGSTDETLDVLQNAGPRVRWTSEPDDGQGEALNKAFERCRGSIIGWLNSDDFYVQRHAVATAVAALEKTSADVVYGGSLWVDEENRVLKLHPRPRFSAKRLRRLDFISQPATFFRRDGLQSPLVDPDAHYSLDYGLWLRLLVEGRQFVRVGAYLAAMRYHLAAKSVRARSEQWEEDAAIRSTAGSSRNAASAVADLAVMGAMKARGLADFLSGAPRSTEWCVPLRLPPLALRPLYQIGVLGSRGSALLLPRYLLGSLREPARKRV